MPLELNTFGAMLAYAMELESRSATFYQDAASRATALALAELFRSLAADAGRRVEILERVRRENVTEMILTPIHDFSSSDYAPDFSLPEGDEGLRSVALALEAVKERYYAAAATRTELAEAARALARLGRGCQRHAEELLNAV